MRSPCLDPAQVGLGHLGVDAHAVQVDQLHQLQPGHGQLARFLEDLVDDAAERGLDLGQGQLRLQGRQAVFQALLAGLGLQVLDLGADLFVPEFLALAEDRARQLQGVVHLGDGIAGDVGIQGDQQVALLHALALLDVDGLDLAAGLGADERVLDRFQGAVDGEEVLEFLGHDGLHLDPQAFSGGEPLPSSCFFWQAAGAMIKSDKMTMKTVFFHCGFPYSRFRALSSRMRASSSCTTAWEWAGFGVEILVVGLGQFHAGGQPLAELAARVVENALRQDDHAARCSFPAPGRRRNRSGPGPWPVSGRRPPVFSGSAPSPVPAGPGPRGPAATRK